MLNRTHPPKSYTPGFKSYTFPSKTEISRNLDLYTFNQGDQEVFKLELIFSSGSVHSVNPALASFCVAMLREGSSVKTAEEINDLFDYYGAFLDNKAGLDSTSISIYGQSRFFPELVSALREILFQPNFPEKMVAKHKEKLIQRLKINHKKTTYWAPRLLRQSLFGTNSHYGSYITLEDIVNVTRDDLVAYHQNTLLPSLEYLILAGSFKDDESIQLIKNSFSELESKDFRSVVETASSIAPVAIQKKLEATTQASIALGKPIHTISDPDYPEIGFLIKVLGGYFGSRLMKKLREEEGLTYGIHAFNIHLRAASYLQISAEVESKSTTKSIDLINKEIDILKNDLVLSDELETVKNYMLGEYINDSNSVFDFAELHRKILLYNLPDNYYESFYTRVGSISSDDILRHAQSVLNQDDFSTVQVL